MKILAIRIKNLASLEGVTEIDFTREPLCSAGIFAITGQTGAGKSTILDALCLALYGKTPRYLQAKENGVDLQDISGSTIRQDDVKGILRDGTAEGFAEVDFKGVDDQHYRATWSVRRARNKIDGSLQPETITLTNISGGAAIPGKKTELQPIIERLVGLNFEQFTRSVLLAQGDFTAFLKAGKDDKSSLLEKLTGTHIYSEISRMIFEKCRAEEQQLHDLHLKKEGVITLNDDEIATLREQQIVWQQDITLLGQQQDAVNAEIAWHERLAELQAAVEAANDRHQKAVSEKQNSIEREVKLRLVERVQPTRTWTDALQAATQQLNDKEASTASLQNQLSNLVQQQQLLKENLANATSDLTGKNEVLQAALPLLETAKKLDVQLSEKKDQLTVATKELQTGRLEQQQHLELVKEKQDAATSLTNAIETLRVWYGEHQSRQIVAENSSLIISKLEDAKKWVIATQEITNGIAAAQGKLQAAIRLQGNLQKELAEKSVNTDLLKQQYLQQQQHLEAIPVESLEKEKLDIDKVVEHTIAAQSHWVLLFDSQHNYQTLLENAGTNSEALIAKQALQKQVSVNLATAKTQKDTAASILEKARITLAGDVESLRSQLEDGEPCPVCGSLEHPYATADPRLHYLLEQLEAEHATLDDAYTVLLKEQSALEQNITNLQTIILQQRIELQQKAKALEGLSQTWQHFSIYQQSNLIPDSEKTNWLQQQVNATKNRQGALLQQVQEYYKKLKNLEAEKSVIDKLEKEQNDLQNKIKDAAREIESLHEAMHRYNQESDKLNTELSVAVQFLEPFFPQSDWYNNWKNNPSAFVKKIEVFAAEWQQKNMLLDAKTKELDILKTTIAGLLQQSAKYMQDVHVKEAQLKNIQNNYNDLSSHRGAIFNGQPVAEKESQLRNAIEAANVHLKHCEETLFNQQNTITKTTTQLEETQHQIGELTNNIAGWRQRIQDWLLNYNLLRGDELNDSILGELLLYNAEWMEQERTALRLLDDAVTQTLSVLNERMNALLQHEAKNVSSQSREALAIALAEIKNAFDDAGKAANEISFRLQQDVANKSKIGDLLEKITAQSIVTENWTKLNEIIGSSDGKKFRQVAQEYTLDVLLGYANHHLETLTRRYKMQRIPNSLGLQVLDQDMGDEIRTVFSLSGGESFLVSLALALGLASLSSSRMKVESLFIDEGFGSLDPATLNIAMDALERLQNQGRKVGVISHVQEMTDRIPVQIKVSKQQSGRSAVEVVGV